MTAEGIFATAAAKAGCPTDQLLNLVRANAGCRSGTGGQCAARLCDGADGPTAIGYGGAREAASSHWLLAQMGVDDVSGCRVEVSAVAQGGQSQS